MLTGLTAALFGPWPETRNDAAPHALVGLDWKWLGSRYSDDSSVRPADPPRYVLRFAPNGRVEVRADCNRAGGHYRLAAPHLTVELTHSTLAACEPGSLETDFRKDLARIGTYLIRNGRLYVELSGDSGTMEFDR
jgi:heat shock protein HslJ